MRVGWLSPQKPGIDVLPRREFKRWRKELRAALELNPNDAEAKKAIDLLQNLHTANHKDATTSDS
jgi:hypothetical protein